MSGQEIIRRNGLSDDYGDSNRTLYMQKCNSSQVADRQSMSGFSQPKQALQNCESYSTDYEGYPPRVVASHQQPVQTSNFLMRSSQSAAHRAYNVSSPRQNVAQRYYGSQPQQTTRFNVPSWSGGVIGEPMGGMENVEIPDDLPTMEIEDYSDKDDGLLYFYDPESKQLRPLEPEEMEQLIITKPDDASEDGQSESNFVAQDSDCNDGKSEQASHMSEQNGDDSRSQIAVAEQSDEQQNVAEANGDES